MAVESQPAGLRFDRNELSGAFGDMGTDLPLLIGMLVASGLDAASVLIVFGVLQIATGIVYRMPMPVQPLKAVAAIVITQRIAPPVLFGGGLAIGVLMLLLATTGMLGWIGRAVPRPVVRGLQLGLGLQLSLLALRDYIPSLGAAGYALAVVSGGIILALFGNRKWPAAPFVIALGVIFAVATSAAPLELAAGPALALPGLRVPQWTDIVTGLLVLALPQLPLSIGNSVLATQQLARDLFPDRPALSLRRIGLTYGIMNVVAPFFGGVPTCHGSGGMAGHYAHGGRTGGSVVIYGTLFVLTGLLFSSGFHVIVQAFPLPTLGVLLLVEAIVLIALLRDLPPRVATGLPLAVMVGLIAALTPYGYLTGMVAGSLVAAAVAGRERTAIR
ncbi:MAG TPA: putative sulfate/molybdate transporter [Gemmatimonadaceae bacterium]|nr:putative sulfate/molybdate transporter [Gemmatimonadaceae bacterium]